MKRTFINVGMIFVLFTIALKYGTGPTIEMYQFMFSLVIGSGLILLQDKYNMKRSLY